MKTRQQIKLEAKAAFLSQYGVSVLLVLLVVAISMVCGFIPFAPIVLLPILAIGMTGGFLAIYRRQRAEVGQLFTPFNQFGRNLGGYWWMYLWTWLWSLLFIIPGIIKGIAYSMTPFILADCPSCRATQALRVSMVMTEGHKWEIFVMQLSFIGWALLGALTFGILDILYVYPYMQASMSGLYEELRDETLRRGILTAQDFA